MSAKLYQNVNLIPPSDRINHDYVKPAPDASNFSPIAVSLEGYLYVFGD